MSFRFKPFVLTAFAVMLSAIPAFSQQAAFVQGVVKGPDGVVIQGAVVAFDGLEMKTHIEAKTDKKGHYVTSMKPTAYSVTVTVDGKVRQTLKQYDAVGGNGEPLDFNLKAAGSTAAPGLTSAPAAGGGGKSSKEDEK